MTASPTESWALLSDEEAALRLAKMSVANAYSRQLQKEAGPREWMAAAKNYAGGMYDTAVKSRYGAAAADLLKKPEAKALLYGAGIGAGIGGLTSLSDEDKRRHFLRNSMTGMLAGGAAGLGGYLGYSHARDVTSGPPGSGSGGATGSAPGPATTIPPRMNIGGRTVDITPAVLDKMTAAQRDKLLKAYNTANPQPNALQRGLSTAYSAIPAPSLGNIDVAGYSLPVPSTTLLAGSYDALRATGRFGERAMGSSSNIDVGLNPNKLHELAMRGKLDDLADKGDDTLKNLIGALKGQKSTGVGADAIRKALVVARATGEPVSIPGVGVLDHAQLAELSRRAGTGGSQGLMPRPLSAVRALVGEPRAPLAGTGYGVGTKLPPELKNNPALVKFLKDVFGDDVFSRSAPAGSGATLAGIPTSRVADPVNSNLAKLPEKLRAALEQSTPAASGSGPAPAPTTLRYKAGPSVNIPGPTVESSGSSMPAPFSVETLRRIAERETLAAEELPGFWNRARRLFSGGVNRGSSFASRIPRAGLVGRAGLYTALPLLDMYLSKQLQASRGSAELEQLLGQYGLGGAK